MEYQGEALLPGYIGYFFVALSFGASLMALISYLIYSQRENIVSWRNTGRGAFWVSGIAVTGIMVVLFFLIYHHRYEYHYVWAHSSNVLPVQYIISCFWEGQEGSFLLWTFWNVLLGVILVRFAGKWEGPVMSVLMLAQVTLSSVLLGIDLFDVKLGSNPFILLRDAFPEKQLFQFPNYVNMIEDGSGLNPLLQNYWMVIHPPVLFLGFALTIVPFAYAVAGLWKKAYKDWVKPVLPWTLASVLVLGTGILMGGAWAYEALNFGGFWAWDPVENASLIPWLLMVGGLHTLLIFKNRGTSLIASLLLLTGGFLFVLYATFLTRSGILGDSSVHSFTGLGLSGQLLFFIFVFLLVALYFLITRWKALPRNKQEDNLYSRDFWMFIGSLVLALAAFHVVFITSLPVFNKIPGVNMAPPADTIQHFNKVQLPVAIVIAILTGFGQFLKYKATQIRKFWRNTGISLIIALILTPLAGWMAGMSNPLFLLLVFASTFAIAGNLHYLIPFIRNNKLRYSGGAIAHAGLGLLLLGVLISTSQQRVISLNREGIDYGKPFNRKSKLENIMLIKDHPKKMGDYRVTYLGDSTHKPNTFYRVLYEKLNSGHATDSFFLYPSAQINPNMGLVASPDTRHYLSRDLYTHVTSVPDKKSKNFQINYRDTGVFLVQPDDSIHFRGLRIIIDGINLKPSPQKVPVENYEIASALNITVSGKNQSYSLSPLFVIKGGGIYTFTDEIREFGFKANFTNIIPQKEKFELTLYKGKPKSPGYIIMKAIIFPWINLLWLGALIMVLGTALSIYRRIKDTGL